MGSARRTVHLGQETQHKWSDLAIAGATPTLPDLFSEVTLVVHILVQQGQRSVRQAAVC